MKKKPLGLTALVIFGIYALYACVLVPFYQIVATDAILQMTLWWDVMEVLLYLTEVLGLSAMLGFLIHGVYRLGWKNARSLYFLCGGALLFKYVASIISLSVVMGTLDLTADFTAQILSFLLEAAIAVLTVFLSHKLISAHTERERMAENACAQLEQDFTPAPALLPLRRPFSRQNPLHRAAFWGGIALLVLRTAAYIIEDIAFTLLGVIFTAADIPITLLYWLILIAIPCFAGYFLILGCILLGEKLQKT